MLRSSLVLALSLLALFPWAASTSMAHNRPVLDVDGNVLQSGVDYFVVSAYNGGGLSLGSWNGKRPFHVMQYWRGVKSGKQIRFTPKSSSTINEIIRQLLPRSWAIGEGMIGAPRSVIRELTDLNIQFSNMTSVWQLGEPDESGRRYVMIGGKAGHSGHLTVNNWFKIKKAEGEGYKIMHCPGVCRSCKTMCGSLGISSQGRRRMLSMPNRPFRVAFMRAEN